jgi:hypothetical protein
MVVRYNDIPADERLRPSHGDVVLRSAVPDARSDRGNARNAHLKTDECTHNGERRHSNSRKQLERGLCVTQLPMRTYVDCWSCAIMGVEVSIVATDER